MRKSLILASIFSLFFRSGFCHRRLTLLVGGVVGVAHVAGAGEGVVEGEGGTQTVGRVAFLGDLEVVPEKFAVVGVRAVLDDAFGALHRILAAKVGYALLGDEDLDGVLTVVDMADHGDDCGDLATFLHRGAGEDREVGVAREVGGAADAVHHLGAEHVGGVDVAEDVGFERCVHCDEAQTAHDLGMVADLAGTHEYLVAEEVDVAHEAEHGVVGEGEGACRCELAFSLFHEVHDGVLNDFGVHLELRNLGILAQTVEHRVGDVAHAGLQWQELLGYATFAEFGGEEMADVVADALGYLICGRERLDAFRSIGGHDAHDLGRVDLKHCGADAVVGAVDGNLAAMRRISRYVVVVESAEGCVVVGGVLDDDFLGHLGDGRSHAETGAEDHLAVGAHLGGFDDGHVDRAVEAVAQILSQMRQMGVDIADLSGVDGLARIGVRLVGCTQIHCVGARELAVDMVVGACTRKKVDLEFFPLLMERLCALGQCHRHNFRCTGCREARQSHIITVFYHRGGLFC